MFIGAVGLAAFLFSGCESMSGGDSAKAASKTASKTLFDRLGGEPAITKVVDDFVAIAATDARVNFFRKGTPNEWKPTDAQVAQFKKLLVQFIGNATGGPVKYEGRDMKTVHAGMKISAAEFGALAADLKSALTKNGVPEKEQAELLAIVSTTQKDIVE
jgi:hemoglobin